MTKDLKQVLIVDPGASKGFRSWKGGDHATLKPSHDAENAF